MFRDSMASFAAALVALVGLCSLIASFTVAAAVATSDVQVALQDRSGSPSSVVARA